MHSVVFARAEVAAYYSARVPNLKQTRASQWRGPCPLHNGKHDNFAVERDTGRWYCHSGCQRGGDITSLERELTSADFKAARDEVFRIVGRNRNMNGVGSSPRAAWRKIA